MLAWADYGFQNFLGQLDKIGFFSYVLPFLLIFAFVYAILSKIPTFVDNKGSVFIVSVAIGFLSLQFGLVTRFFAVIFPQLGVGLSILLAALILAGVFVQGDSKNYQWIFFGLGALIFIIIVITSLSDFNFSNGFWWQEYGALSIVVLFIVVALVVIAVLNKNSSAPVKP